MFLGLVLSMPLGESFLIVPMWRGEYGTCRAVSHPPDIDALVVLCTQGSMSQTELQLPCATRTGFVCIHQFVFNKKHPLAGEARVCPACARRHAGVHEWRLQPNSVTSRPH